MDELWDVWRVVSYVDDDDNWHVVAETPVIYGATKEQAEWMIKGHVEIYWHGKLPENLDYELRPA